MCKNQSCNLWLLEKWRSPESRKHHNQTTWLTEESCEKTDFTKKNKQLVLTQTPSEEKNFPLFPNEYWTLIVFRKWILMSVSSCFYRSQMTSVQVYVRSSSSFAKVGWLHTLASQGADFNLHLEQLNYLIS